MTARPLVPITGVPVKGTVSLVTGATRDALRYNIADGGGTFVDYRQPRRRYDAQLDRDVDAPRWVRASGRLARTFKPTPADDDLPAES